MHSMTSKKLESLDYPLVKPHDPRFIRFGTLPASDGQTDMLAIAKSRCSIAEHSNNLII